MPIYEYQCQQCGHLLDALQKINEEALIDCPSCGKPKLKRLISAPNFRLKGKGWYETDFKKENQKNLAEDKEDKPAKKEEKKIENKSEETKKKKAVKDKAPKDKE